MKFTDIKISGLTRDRLTFLLVLLIFVLAFSIRLIWVINPNPWYYPSGLGWGELKDFLGYDGVRYDWIANNLVNGAGYGYKAFVPDSWRPPGYPFFLAFIYTFLGHDYYYVRISQCFLGALICLIIFFFTRKLSKDMPFSLSLSFTAALFYALNFYSIIFTNLLYSELLASFFILLAIYLFYLSDGQRRPRFYFLFSTATLLYWYAVLIRPANILFWGWIILWLFFRNRSQLRRFLGGIAIIILGFSLVILPWTIRNYNVHKKFLLVSSNGGFIFFMAHHPRSDGKIVPVGERYLPGQKSNINNLDEIQRDKVYFLSGIRFIKNDFRRFLRLSLLKQKRLWFDSAPTTLIRKDHAKIFFPSQKTLKKVREGVFAKEKNVYFGFFPSTQIPLIKFHALVLLSGLALAFLFGNYQRFFLPLAYLFNYAATISFFYFYDGPRTRLEMVPFLCILASFGIIGLFLYLRNVRGGWPFQTYPEN